MENKRWVMYFHYGKQFTLSTPFPLLLLNTDSKGQSGVRIYRLTNTFDFLFASKRVVYYKHFFQALSPFGVALIANSIMMSSSYSDKTLTVHGKMYSSYIPLYSMSKLSTKSNVYIYRTIMSCNKQFSSNSSDGMYIQIFTVLLKSDIVFDSSDSGLVTV